MSNIRAILSVGDPPAWAAVPPRDRPLDPNSALRWLPAAENNGRVPVPRTEIVRVDPLALWGEIGEAGDNAKGAIPVDWAAMERAAEAIGYPCFVRTDLASAKHDGPESYRVNGPEDIRGVVLQTFYDNAMKDLAAGPTPLRAILFRQWLDLDAPFTAFGGHPIAREWRLFADGSRVHCRHFYWPAEAIEDHTPSTPDWRTRLATMGRLARGMRDLLDVAAVVAAGTLAESLPGEVWSVDFARDRAHRWWLIDMARARSSWHPADCKGHAATPADGRGGA